MLPCRDCQTWGSSLEQHVCHQAANGCLQDFVTFLFFQEWLPSHFPELSILLSEDRKDKLLLTQHAHIQFYQSYCFCLASLFMALIIYSLFSGSLSEYSQSEMSPLRGVTSLHPWALLKQEGFNSPSSSIPFSFPCKRWRVFINPFLQTSEDLKVWRRNYFPYW